MPAHTDNAVVNSFGEIVQKRNILVISFYQQIFINRSYKIPKRYSNWPQPGRLFLNYIHMYAYPQNLLSLTIRDLKMLESSGFHQNVDLGSLLSKFISDFGNPFQKRESVKIVNFWSFFPGYGLFTGIKNIILNKMLYVTCSTLLDKHDKL